MTGQTSPSLRLRLLTGVMRRLIKPKLRRTATPQEAHRDFERAAPFVFSVPRGVELGPAGQIQRVSAGPAQHPGAILYIHGGAFFTGSLRSYRAMAGRLAKRAGVPVYLADYPLLQNAPFPAAPEAVVRGWDALLREGYAPHQIVIAGDSAGGNLALGLLAHVLAKGQRPAGVLAFSPWADLTLSGATIETNRQADPLVPVSRMREAVSLYLDGAAPTDPRASPLFADFPTPPASLIQVGAEEVLLSDAERMAKRLGGTLSVWLGCPHVWQIFDPRLPEARAAMREAGRFVQTSLDSAKR